ncbi:M48 family metalloprotease [Cognatishimia sp. MH4019]|uniref:M48 family metalloprotease n=1 Tax=Cognatishimia sp. MH4019 TaxID=2854030 RepID=UPI001CD54672|nr:M48 family metalloprotease [Cognatishimia sp. MH4019]
MRFFQASPRPSMVLALLCVMLTAMLSFGALSPAKAQGLIRDAEIERGLREISAPILNAAGLSPARVKVLLINDSSLNAFVADPNHIFVHTGLVLRMKRVEELQAVIAHEAAHISNGHLTRRMANMKAARRNALLGLAVSLAAGAANPQAGAGLAIGSQETVRRFFFAHTRAEEAAADQSAARYMARAGVDPSAAVDVLNIFRGQEALSVGRQDPYTRTHPLTRDRIRAMQGAAAAYKENAREDPRAQAWFSQVQGKLSAFLRAPGWTLNRVKRNDTSANALMRKAVAYHRKPDRKRAFANINALAQARPNNPYAHELRGQIHLENRDFGTAVNAYGRAVQLAPNEPLILAGYGRSLLALNTADGNRRALQALEKSRQRDPLNPRMLRDLAQAYAKAGNNGMASLTTAERYAFSGRLKDAAVHAKRAEGLLPRGSAPWQRAQDMIFAAQTTKR